MHDLLERADIRGRVVTLDALHTVPQHRAAVQGAPRCRLPDDRQGERPETFALLEGIDWERRRDGWHMEKLGQGPRLVRTAHDRFNDAAARRGQPPRPPAGRVRYDTVSG